MNRRVLEIIGLIILIFILAAIDEYLTDKFGITPPGFDP